MTAEDIKKLAAHHASEARSLCEIAAQARDDQETIEALAEAQQHVAWHRGLIELAAKVDTPSFP